MVPPGWSVAMAASRRFGCRTPQIRHFTMNLFMYIAKVFAMTPLSQPNMRPVHHLRLIEKHLPFFTRERTKTMTLSSNAKIDEHHRDDSVIWCLCLCGDDLWCVWTFTVCIDCLEYWQNGSLTIISGNLSVNTHSRDLRQCDNNVSQLSFDAGTKMLGKFHGSLSMENATVINCL